MKKVLSVLTLILITFIASAQIGWNNLASNQMVSFTDAQGSPFSLNAGQSHVTSNKLMTKSDALTKYNLNAASMSGYFDGQLVPKGVWQTGVVYQSEPYTGYATKNNCGSSANGSTVGLTAYRGQFTSTVNQIDADNQAISWVNANKQSYANTNGSCTNFYMAIGMGTFSVISAYNACGKPDQSIGLYTTNPSYVLNVGDVAYYYNGDGFVPDEIGQTYYYSYMEGGNKIYIKVVSSIVTEKAACIQYYAINPTAKYTPLSSTNNTCLTGLSTGETYYTTNSSGAVLIGDILYQTSSGGIWLTAFDYYFSYIDVNGLRRWVLKNKNGGVESWGTCSPVTASISERLRNFRADLTQAVSCNVVISIKYTVNDGPDEFDSITIPAGSTSYSETFNRWLRGDIISFTITGVSPAICDGLIINY